MLLVGRRCLVASVGTMGGGVLPTGCHLYHLVVGLTPEAPGKGQKGQPKPALYPKQVYKVATTHVNGQAPWDLLAPVACGADFSLRWHSVACPHPTL